MSSPAPGSLPTVLIVSATPLRGSWATSHLMTDLFAHWPDTALAQVTVERDGSIPADQGIDSCYLALAGSRRPWQLLREVRRMRSFVRSHDPQVVYFRSGGWPLVLELVPLVLRRPVVTHVMDDWIEAMRVTNPRRASWLDRVIRHVLRRSACRLAISGPMAEAFGQRYGMPFEVVHAAVDQAPATVRPVADDDRIVLYSGNVAENQTATALGDVAEAIHRLHELDGRVRLVVAPSTPLPAELERRLGHAEATVVGQGTRAEYLARLEQAAVVLATSNFDDESIAFLRYSMPNKIPELLTSGTPILMYAPAELAYVQAAQRDGWASVVTSDDVAELATSISQLITDDELRSHVTAAAAAASTTTFSAAAIHARFRTALTQSMGRST